jgi:hypothetical protein
VIIKETRDRIKRPCEETYMKQNNKQWAQIKGSTCGRIKENGKGLFIG